jgi:hypothetical protein
MRHPSRVAAIILTLLFSTPAFTTAQTPPAELNRAQQLVFVENHIQNVPRGSILTYAFNSETKGVERYSDTVKITVTGVLEDGRRNLEFDFLSGPHHIDFSPAQGYSGNPVIIHFLERDISRMARETSGWSGYFRNRIRDSFGQPVSVRDIKISLQGRELNGVEVVVEPFVSDPNIQNFEAYANKRYEFIFSDQIPGGVYRIHTRVPGENGADVFIDEALTFTQLTEKSE